VTIPTLGTNAHPRMVPRSRCRPRVGAFH